MDKPEGVTSHDAVAVVRRRFGTRAVGHTGTLDPFATGLLVVVLGRATRLARFVEAGRKVYLAAARLGLRTTTDDRMGEPLPPEVAGDWPTPERVEHALAGLTGTYLQRPPAFSAKRVGGHRSYDLARAGVAVELTPVPVEVYRIELVEYAPPLVRFRAVVGPGTYLRAVARDLGEALGTGAHLIALRREQVGPFRVEDATPLDQITGREQLLPPRALVPDLLPVALAPEDAARVRHGRAVGEAAAEGERVALLDGGLLVAVAEGQAGRWQPVVVLASDD